LCTALCVQQRGWLTSQTSLVRAHDLDRVITSA
jgi:hypothetical protein